MLFALQIAKYSSVLAVGLIAGTTLRLLFEKTLSALLPFY